MSGALQNIPAVINQGKIPLKILNIIESLIPLLRFLDVNRNHREARPAQGRYQMPSNKPTSPTHHHPAIVFLLHAN